MATTDNVLSDFIINDLTQEEYNALVTAGEVQEGQIYATDYTSPDWIESVAHDSSLEGAGTQESPLKVASTVIAQINDKADSTVVEAISSVVSENTTKLNTLRNDTDSLGDQVSGIEEKIPSSASATNQLVTKTDLSTDLNKKADDDKVVHLAGTETITGIKSFTIPDNIKFPASKTAGYTPGSTNATTGATPATNVPWARNGWHDHFAFGLSFYLLSREVSTDGETWAADDRDISYLFTQKEYGSTGELVLAPNAGEMGFRFVLQGSNIAYSNIQWIEIGFAYSSAHTVRLLVESSSDGTEWTEVHNSTTSASATHRFLYVGNLSTGNTYLRISIIKTDTAYLDAITRMLYVKGWTTRKGNQGRGIEFEKPYFWDNIPNIMPIKSSGCNLGSTSRRWGTTYTTNINVGGQMFDADSVKKLNNLPETVDLTDYVKNTDYASASKGGVFKTSANYGTQVGASGSLYGRVETVESLATRNDNAFISKGTLENIKDDYVKRGITENGTALTDEEKTAAQDWLGIKQGASLPILTMFMSDHIINDISWLRANTFSWQSGDVYVAAYEHLVGDLASVPGTQYYAWLMYGTDSYYTTVSSPNTRDKIYYKNASGDMIQIWEVMEGGSQTIYNQYGDELVRDSTKDEVVLQKQTDTIGDITVSYYLAEDGHKICLPDQESNITALYEKTGAADYYILDTTNKQFKLPRKQKRTLIQAVKNDDGTWYNLYSDGWVEQGGQIIRGSITFAIPMADLNYTVSGAQIRSGSTNGTYYNAYKFVNMRETGIDLDNAQSEDPLIAWSVSGYAAESAYASAGMRLEYYYVGNFTQEAIEQTAGLNAELFNSKADLSRVEVLESYDYVVESQLPTADNGYTWYRKYKSGWVEQGGKLSGRSITFPIQFALLPTLTTSTVGTDTNVVANNHISDIKTTGFDGFYQSMNAGWTGSARNMNGYWTAFGFATQE